MISARLLHLRRCTTSLRRIPSAAHLLQSNKRIMELARLGRVVDARYLFDGMPIRDAVSWNSMITAYIQNDQLKEAESLFEAFGGKNVRTWTILLSGYVSKGLLRQAMWLFERMPERNEVSWNVMIKGFVQSGDLRRARKLFDDMPHRNISSWNTMIMGYCWCGLVEEARELFYNMGERDSVSWVVMIGGYVELRQYREAWDLFQMMVRLSLRVDQPIMVVAASCLAVLNDSVALDSFRAFQTKVGFDDDVVVATAVLKAYTNFGRLDEAIKFFNTMPERNEYTWTTMIAGFSRFHQLGFAVALYEQITEKCTSVKTTMAAAYARCGKILEATQLFNEIKDPDVLSWNSMITAYSENGMFQEAENTFRKMPLHNASSWAALISGFVHGGKSREALEVFSMLHSSGTFPNHLSFTSSLFACKEIGDFELGRQIHGLTIKRMCQLNCFVGNALISMYAKCNNVRDLSCAFSSMKSRDVVSWNSLISGISENWMLKESRMIFDRMPRRDSVSWASIISAYEQAGLGDSALGIFQDMIGKGIRPTELAVTSLLAACSKLSYGRMGKQIHTIVIKLGFHAFLFVYNSLLTMYFKCGFLDGFHIFHEMLKRDIISWNVIIAGCARNGLGKQALELFEEMKKDGICPDAITFLGVLSACSRAGFVDKGEALFKDMTEQYGIRPSLHHYTCMVKLLGKMGQFKKAREIIEKINVEADSVIWEALLSASRNHHDVELGRRSSDSMVDTGMEIYNLSVPRRHQLEMTRGKG